MFWPIVPVQGPRISGVFCVRGTATIGPGCVKTLTATHLPKNRLHQKLVELRSACEEWFWHPLFGTSFEFSHSLGRTRTKDFRGAPQGMLRRVIARSASKPGNVKLRKFVQGVIEGGFDCVARLRQRLASMNVRRRLCRDREHPGSEIQDDDFQKLAGLLHRYQLP